MSMAKQGAKAAVPRLRFPEFQDAGEWTIGELEGVANFVNEKISVSTLSTCDYISTENLLPDYGETVVSTKLPDVASVTRYKCGDVLISNIRPYLKKVWRADKDGGASNDVIVVRAKTSLSEAFLSLVLRNDAFIAYVMESAKGVKMPRGDIGAMRQYPLAYPTPAEQQKIADCLTSLDEMIAAQGRNVEALKAHKRGLMQQLFPREGETRPRLRFPEFRDAPEWKEKKLGDITTIVRGGSPRPIDGFLTSSPDGLNWLKIGDVDRETMFVTKTADKVRPDALSKTRVIQPGDFILSNSMSFGRPYISAIETCIHDGWIAVTRIPDSLGRKFLYYSILSERSQAYFVDQAAGSGVQNLNKDIIKSLVLGMPAVEEQQRIADCLSSLDNQITAESNQLAALKTHKQGLMQQLFPAPEAATA